MAYAAEDVVAAFSAAGADDEIVFASGDWLAEDDLGVNFRRLEVLRVPGTRV